MKNNQEEHWIISFRASGNSPVPAGRRVARLLKFALRCCGLRCVKCWPAGSVVMPPEQISLDAAGAQSVESSSSVL